MQANVAINFIVRQTKIAENQLVVISKQSQYTEIQFVLSF